MKLYQESIKGKDKVVEINFIDHMSPEDAPIKLTVSDFFKDDDGDVNRDENVA